MLWGSQKVHDPESWKQEENAWHSINLLCEHLQEKEHSWSKVPVTQEKPIDILEELQVFQTALQSEFLKLFFKKLTSST